MAINTTGFTQSKTIYVDFDQDRKPSLRDIGSDQIGANGAKEISFGFGSEDLSGHTVVLETKRVVDSGLKYAIASVYTDGTSTRYKVPLTSWFTTYRSALIMAVKVFNNNGVTVVDGEITEIDNDYLISVSDTFTLTVNYAPKATAVVPSFSASELELILAAIAGKQDTANGIVVLQESDALPDVSDGSKNGWTYLKKNADYSYSVYKVVDDTLELIQENLFKRVSFDTTTPETTLPIGTMAWSQEHRTIVFRVNDEVVLEINQEFVFDSKASGTVNNGYPVFFVQPQGNHAISKQATANDVIANPYGLRGIATETVSNNKFFKTTQLGRVDGINTTKWALENGGSILYFDITESGTGAYNMTTIAPTKPNQVIKMGSIEKWSTGGANNGRIIVRIDYGESLGTLHDVDLSDVATGDILRKTNGTWTPTSDLTDLEARTTVVESDITKIENGTTIVKKAEQDKNGNDIVETYATKANTYTKTEVDNKVASVYKYKGSVDTFDDLPMTDLVVGDVYNVIDSGINYAWTGTEWDDIGGIEALATATNNGLMSKEDFSKLSALYDKATLDDLLGAKVDKTTTVNSKALSGNITLDKTDIGLGNVDNTSDVNKPVSTAQQTALNLKADKVVLTNLVSNGGFDANTTGWTSGDSANTWLTGGYLVNTGSGTSLAPYTQQIITSSAISGSKYYAKIRVRVTNALCSSIRFRVNATGSFDTVQLTPTINTWYELSAIFTANANGNITILPTHIYANTTNATNAVMEIDYVYISILTPTFGAGNEPTKEQMDAIMTLKGGYFSTATINVIDVMKLFAPKTQEAWLTPTLTNSWTNVSGFTTKYKKDTMGVVWVELFITGGVNGSDIFTLPSGYRPQQLLFITGNASGNLGTVAIATGGQVSHNAGTTTANHRYVFSFRTN